MAIIGADPSGLRLARILASRRIAATVLESGEHSSARPQDGPSDLHADSGPLALREAGLKMHQIAVLACRDDALQHVAGRRPDRLELAVDTVFLTWLPSGGLEIDIPEDAVGRTPAPCANGTKGTCPPTSDVATQALPNNRPTHARRPSSEHL